MAAAGRRCGLRRTGTASAAAPAEKNFKLRDSLPTLKSPSASDRGYVSGRTRAWLKRKNPAFRAPLIDHLLRPISAAMRRSRAISQRWPRRPGDAELSGEMPDESTQVHHPAW